MKFQPNKKNKDFDQESLDQMVITNEEKMRMVNSCQSLGTCPWGIFNDPEFVEGSDQDLKSSLEEKQKEENVKSEKISGYIIFGFLVLAYIMYLWFVFEQVYYRTYLRNIIDGKLVDFYNNSWYVVSLATFVLFFITFCITFIIAFLVYIFSLPNQLH